MAKARNLATCDLTQLTKRYGGDSVDTVERMIVDSDSTVYLAGNSYSSGSHGKQDTLVIKLDSSREQVWGKFYGGSEEEATGDMAVSSDGVYIAGNTQTPAMTNGARDIFVLKLSKSDGSKTFAMLFGSTNDEYAVSIQVESSNIYVGGYSSSSGWTSGASDFVIFKLDATTGAKSWSKYFGGGNNDLLTDLVVSGSVIYGLGYGDVGAGGDDLLLMQASTNDGSLSSYHYLSNAANSETSSRMRIDSNGYLYIAGGSSSSGLTHGFSDIIVMKVNPSTYAIEWGQYIGSSSKPDIAEDILLSSDETSIYIIGYTDATEITFGSNDILMIKASASTGNTEFVVHLGGDIQDYGRTMYVQSNGKYLISGETTSSSLSAASTIDILLLEIDSEGRNQCSLLEREDVTTTLSSSSFSTSTYTFTSYSPSSGSISDSVRTASGDSLSDSSTSFTDICSNYYPVISEEGLTDPQYAYEDNTFSSTLPEFCDSTGSTLTYSLTKADGSTLPSWMFLIRPLELFQEYLHRLIMVT